MNRSENNTFTQVFEDSYETQTLGTLSLTP